MYFESKQKKLSKLEIHMQDLSILLGNKIFEVVSDAQDTFSLVNEEKVEELKSSFYNLLKP